MSIVQSSRRPRGLRLGVLPVVVTAALTASALAAGGATSPLLRSVNEKGYAHALANHSSRTLYLLSVERGAKVKCAAACLRTWPPMLVNDSVRTVTLGAGVRGTIGFVARGKTMKQVTFNSFPVYTFVGDSAALQSHGAGIVADGGTWHLVNAGATSARTTALSPAATSVTTTTASGGYGY